MENGRKWPWPNRGTNIHFMEGLRKTMEDLKICWVADEIRTDHLLNKKS
jgi:hypothetical protein